MQTKTSYKMVAGDNAAESEVSRSNSQLRRVNAWTFCSEDNPHGNYGWPTIAFETWTRNHASGHGSVQGASSKHARFSAGAFLGCERPRLAVHLWEKLAILVRIPI